MFARLLLTQMQMIPNLCNSVCVVMYREARVSVAALSSSFLVFLGDRLAVQYRLRRTDRVLVSCLSQLPSDLLFLSHFELDLLFSPSLLPFSQFPILPPTLLELTGLLPPLPLNLQRSPTSCAQFPLFNPLSQDAARDLAVLRARASLLAFYHDARR